MSSRKTLLYHMFQFLNSLRNRSTCSRAKVAAMLTDPLFHRIHSFGYNGDVAGGDNKCDSTEVGNCGCIHAEVNALLKARPSESVLVMLSTESPCKMCAKAIVNAGVKMFYFEKWYREPEHVHILLDAKVLVCRYHKGPDDVAGITRTFLDRIVRGQGANL